MRGETLRLDILAPPPVLRLCVLKGSIALDGISLTINALTDASFAVGIVPHSLQQTLLAEKRVGDRVNIENDMIGKYVARLMPSAAGLTMDKLREHGFVSGS